MVSAHGSVSAQAFLLADGATDADLRSGYALTGDNERLLKILLSGTGLHLEELWRTLLIKDRINLSKPAANKNLLTDDYKRILLNEINTIKPNVIVPLSELSFNFLTGLSGIRKFRGSVLHPSGNLELFRSTIRILPILGPNPYLREDAKLEFISRLDFRKLPANLERTEPIVEIGKCWVAQTGEQLRQFFERHYTKCLKENGYLVFDIETYANIPTCISFCFDGDESCCVPLLDYEIDVTQRAVMLSLALKLLRSPLRKVNQNIKFDWKKLARLGWEICNVAGDTMLAANCLYAEFPKNLGFLTSIYTDIPYFKDEGKEFDPAKYERNKLYIYNAKDSLATHKIYNKQQVELLEQGVQQVYSKLIEILPIYKEMEETGILVDDYQRRKLLSKYTCLFEIYSGKLELLCSRRVNPLSAVEAGRLVYDELDWQVVRGVKHSKISGKPSADEESLEILMWSSHPKVSSYESKAILRCIIDCRKLHKCIEFLSLPTYPDGRHRCEFNLAGAETGRTTAGQTTDYYLEVKDGKVKLSNMGHSFQTIGKHGFVVDGEECGTDLKSIFIPSHGHNFVECDLSQAEARVDAVLACDFGMLEVFDGPVGIHRLTGSWVFGCKPEEIQKGLTAEGIDRYHLAKMVRHAAERNMTSLRLLMMIQKEISFCDKILKIFHSRQPNIRGMFHRDVREQIQKDRVLIAPNGRRRDFFGRINEDTINEGISFLPQAIVTDYIKWPLAETISTCRDFIRPLSESHDSFLCEVESGREREYAAVFKRGVEQPVDFRSCSLSRDFKLTIPVETEWSQTNWQELRRLEL